MEVPMSSFKGESISMSVVPPRLGSGSGNCIMVGIRNSGEGTMLQLGMLVWKEGFMAGYPTLMDVEGGLLIVGRRRG